MWKINSYNLVTPGETILTLRRGYETMSVGVHPETGPYAAIKENLDAEIDEQHRYVVFGGDDPVPHYVWQKDVDPYESGDDYLLSYENTVVYRGRIYHVFAGTHGPTLEREREEEARYQREHEERVAKLKAEKEAAA